MQVNLLPEDDSGLPPPGQRWGTGAQSVLPYLTKTLLAKPADTAHARETPRGSNAGERRTEPLRDR